jgi:hypothetical protein
VLDLAQTWNNAAVAFTAINLDITNTASNLAGSKMVNFSVGGANIFSIYRSTNGSFPGATMVELGNSGLTTRIRTRTGAGVGLNFENTVGVGSLQFGAGSGTGGGDLILVRDDAANILALRNSTAAQEFRLYNTFTSATNHERGFLKWSSNVFQIGTEKGSGGGTARALEFQTDGIGRLTITSTGLFQFGGASSGFPALKRAGSVLQVRFADDLAYTTLEALHRLFGAAPATTGATGTPGDLRYDADYIYVCTAANTWKRAAIATW